MVEIPELHIEEISNKIDKDLLSPKDLCQIGLFKSTSTLYRLRLNKQGPPFFQISPGIIRYNKKDLINWLRTKYFKEEKKALKIVRNQAEHE